MKYTLQVRLNDDREIDRVIMDVLGQCENNADAARELMYSAIVGNMQTEQGEHVQIDNSEVLKAINELRNDIKSMMRSGISQQVETVTMPGGIEATLEEIDPNADTPFLSGVRKMGARPGMRLDD